MSKVRNGFLALLVLVSSVLTCFARGSTASAATYDITKAPGGITAVAAYIISGLMVAGGGAAAALDSGIADDIRKKSTDIYNSLDSASKSLMNTTIQNAVSNGVKSVTLSQDIIDALKTKVSTIGGFTNANLDLDSKKEYGASTATYKFNLLSSSSKNIETLTGFVVTATGHTGIRISGQTYSSYNQYYVYGSVTDSGGTSSYIFDSDKLIEKAMYDLLNSSTGALWFSYYSSITGAYVHKLNSVVPPSTYFDNSINKALDDLGAGIKEINIPIDNFIAKDKTTGNVVSDPTTYTGDLVWDYPIPQPKVGVTAPTVDVPAIPVGDITTGVGTTPWVVPDTAVDTPTDTTWENGDPVGEGTPPTDGYSNPFMNLLPIAFLAALLDLLRAILAYIGRMFVFIATIPIIPEKPFDNEAFTWFKSAKIIGVHIYTVVSSLATIGLSFAVYKAIRRLLP